MGKISEAHIAAQPHIAVVRCLMTQPVKTVPTPIITTVRKLIEQSKTTAPTNNHANDNIKHNGNKAAPCRRDFLIICTKDYVSRKEDNSKKNIKS